MRGGTRGIYKSKGRRAGFAAKCGGVLLVVATLYCFQSSDDANSFTAIRASEVTAVNQASLGSKAYDERSLAPFVTAIIKKTNDARADFDVDTQNETLVTKRWRTAVSLVLDTLAENLATLTNRKATQAPALAVAIFGASNGDFGEITDDRVQPFIRRKVKLNGRDMALQKMVTGVLAEPDPVNFGILQRNMAGFDQLELFNGVVSNNCSSTTLPFYAPSPQFILENPGAAHHQKYQLGSLSETSFKKAFYSIYARYHHVYEIKCGSSKEMFKRWGMAGKDILSGAPHILQVDVQGLDHLLIRDVLAFTRPLVMIWEDEGRSEEQILELRAEVAKMKYLYFDDASNTIAVYVGDELNDADLAEVQRVVKPVACRSHKLCKTVDLPPILPPVTADEMKAIGAEWGGTCEGAKEKFGWKHMKTWGSTTPIAKAWIVQYCAAEEHTRDRVV